MSDQTFALVQRILKEAYVGQLVTDETFKELPFYATVPKDEEMGGLVYPVPIKWGNTQGASAVYATAAANSKPAKYDSFKLTYSEKFLPATIQGKLIRTTKRDRDSFVKSFQACTEDTIAGLARALAIDLTRDHGGSIGRLSGTTGITTGTVTLANASDAVNFEVDMVVEASATATGGSVKSGTLVVQSVDIEAGTVTFTTHYDDTVSGGAVGDYLFREDDYDACIYGVRDWCPLTAPSSGESFFGVDRSKHSRLYGTITDQSGAGSMEEALYRGVTLAAKKGGNFSHYLLNDEDMGNLELGVAQKIYIDVKAADIELFFTALKIRGPKGPVLCLADNTVEKGYGLGIPMSDACLHSTGPAVSILDEDGQKWLRTTGDSYETRFGFTGQFSVSSPNSLVRVKLPA